MVERLDQGPDAAGRQWRERGAVARDRGEDSYLTYDTKADGCTQHFCSPAGPWTEVSVAPDYPFYSQQGRFPVISIAGNTIVIVYSDNPPQDSAWDSTRVFVAIPPVSSLPSGDWQAADVSGDSPNQSVESALAADGSTIMVAWGKAQDSTDATIMESTETAGGSRSQPQTVIPTSGGAGTVIGAGAANGVDTLAVEQPEAGPNPVYPATPTGGHEPWTRRRGHGCPPSPRSSGDDG